MSQKSHDSKLLPKLNSNQSVAYHSNCLSLYQISMKRQNEERPEPSDWHKNRQLRQLAFNALCEIITETIVKYRVMYLNDLLSQYKFLLLKFGEGQVHAEDLHEYRAENLESKIMKAFGEQVTIECSKGTPKIVYQYNLDSSQLVSEYAAIESNTKNRCRDVAYVLRNTSSKMSYYEKEQARLLRLLAEYEAEEEDGGELLPSEESNADENVSEQDVQCDMDIEEEDCTLVSEKIAVCVVDIQRYTRSDSLALSLHT
ncbi:hypothetical protein RN001_011799 [Aquatica leii]|uniref:Uncharacterized protein n=1 Tax=Aquatica leii TaxID=1421715 RepID=A0AAN7PTF5_9COLE|nr:hypothetical protein RN001_011799 [Aquatica leii]